MTLQRHITQPDIIGGSILNPERGFWGVEVPTEQTNWILNPSSEASITGWSQAGGATAVSQSATVAYAGQYSMRALGAAGNTGALYQMANLPAGTYRFSCALYASAGGTIRLTIAGTTFDAGQADAVMAIGEWIIFEFPSPIIVPSVSFSAGFTFEMQTVQNQFFVDAMLLESGTAISEYFDGNTPGCYWLGTANQSRSFRTLDANSGPVLNFDDCGFLVDGYSGAGMPTVDAQKTDYALLDGAAYTGTRAVERVMGLSGRFSGTSHQAVQQQRAVLIDAINRDRTSSDLPVYLRYRAYRGLAPLGRPLRIAAAYIGGLEGDVASLYNEQCVIQFRADDPYFREVIASAASLAASASVTMDRIIRYDRNHVWSDMGSGPDNDAVRALLRGPDGYLYVGGGFSTVNGIANTRYLARWREDVGWESIGTLSIGASGRGVQALAIASNGDILVGGDFLDVNGVANTVRLARYRPSTGAWSAITAGGANASVRALAIDNAGRIYAGGDFTVINGLPITYLAQFNSSGVASVVGSAAPNNVVLALAVDSANGLYAGGLFTTLGGISASRIARWSGSAWSALGAGISGGGILNVSTIKIAPSGIVYAGGQFTTAGAVAANHIAAWNGSAWSALGSGITSAATQSVQSITFDPKGNLYAGGEFTGAGGGSITYQGVAMWNGYIWLRPDITFPSTPIVYALLAEAAGLTIGCNVSGVALVGGSTVLTSTATATVQPTITLTNATANDHRLYQLLNVTSGDAAYLDLIVLAGETITLDLATRRILSNVRGDLTYTIRAGSNFATWKILPRRANYINLYLPLAGQTAAYVANNPHWSVDGGVLR